MTSRTTTKRAARPAGASIPSGLARQQRRRRTALKTLARLRAEASAEIERLIGFLDATDQYVTTELEADAEPTDEEIRDFAHDGSWQPQGEDDEPSLAALEGHDNQDGIAWDASWQGHGSHDREEQCDDEGIDDDREHDREDGAAFPEGMMDQTVKPAYGMTDGIGGVL